MILHLVFNHAESTRALQRCLAVARSDDMIILMNPTATQLQRTLPLVDPTETTSIHLLNHTSCLPPCAIPQISLSEFTDLCVRFPKSVSWK